MCGWDSRACLSGWLWVLYRFRGIGATAGGCCPQLQPLLLMCFSGTDTAYVCPAYRYRPWHSPRASLCECLAGVAQAI